MIQLGDWVEWARVPFYPDEIMFGQVIHIEEVELERTLRHPFKKRQAKRLLIVTESGKTHLTRLEYEVKRVPTAEEELGGDYV